MLTNALDKRFMVKSDGGKRSQRTQIFQDFAEEWTEGALGEFVKLENDIHRIIKP